MGDYLPLHAGASGKVLLAYLPEEKREQIIAGIPLKRYTSLTITNRKDLEESLEEIRKKGFGISRGEREPDAYSVVAPILD